jgi:hypothetical protein
MISIKIISAIIAALIGIIAFLPYLKDIFYKKTKPHVYTWLIWTLTTGTGVFAIWYGSGGFGALNLTVGLIFIFVIFLFSLKYGTKDITKSDTIILFFAICAILVWWQLNQPLISIIMISVIDFLGYIPTFRKSYKQPWSETLSSWMLFVISDIFAIFALESYNALTLTYLSTITMANLFIFLICIFRRPHVKNPAIKF